MFNFISEQYNDQHTRFNDKELRFVESLLADMAYGDDGFIPRLLSPQGRNFVAYILSTHSLPTGGAPGPC